MEFKEFKIKYAETMLNYQAIEHNIKFIYAFMKAGDVNKHFYEIENKTLGKMIRKLKELDNSDKKLYISSGDYNFLTQICDNRNHWAHSVFTEFIYKNDCFSLREYQKQCAKLGKGHDRVQAAFDILEKIRIDYCKSIRK